MKLSELRVEEHLKGPHGGVVDSELLQSWLDASSRLDFALPYSNGHLVVHLHQMDQRHQVIVLTDIQNQKVPVGYLVMVQSGAYWNVNDVVLYDHARGQGVGPELYRQLAAHGYKLQSGGVLSDDAEKMWLKLGAGGRVRTIDTTTGEVSDFSELPMKDLSHTPRWRWVMEAAYAPAWDKRPLFEGHPGLQRWLDGKIDAMNCDIRWPGLENDGR